MPTLRPPNVIRTRTLIAALSIVSILAFTLGQGVAAFQANLTLPRIIAASRFTERVSIAHGVTPTPTVHPSSASASAKVRFSATRSAPLSLASSADPAHIPGDNGKHGDQQADQHGDKHGDHQPDKHGNGHADKPADKPADQHGNDHGAIQAPQPGKDQGHGQPGVSVTATVQAPGVQPAGPTGTQTTGVTQQAQDTQKTAKP